MVIFNRFAKIFFEMKAPVIYSFLLCSGILLASCNTETTPSESTTTDTTTAEAKPTVPTESPKSNLGDTATNQLVQVLNDYYLLKDALVASDVAKTVDAAARLQVSAAALETRIASGNATVAKSITTIATEAKAIIAEKTDVEKQRIPFEKVSDAIYAAVKDAQLEHAGVYRQYCPMAFNDKGAYWLSNEEKIMNPYFGKKMLTCGEVTDTLR